MSGGNQDHPASHLLHLARMPSVWCAGCGIGIVVNTFIQTVHKLNLNPSELFVFSSQLGCTGKIAEYLKFKQPPSKERNLFLSALRFKQKRPESRVVIFFNENDLLVSGIDDFLFLCERGKGVLAVFINSFIHHLFLQHRELECFPLGKKILEKESQFLFNMPEEVEKCGASLVARWTPLHCRRLMFSMKKSFSKHGFSFIEVISPCLMYHASERGLGKKLHRMDDFLKNSAIMDGKSKDNLDTRENRIIVGNFVDN